LTLTEHISSRRPEIADLVADAAPRFLHIPYLHAALHVCIVTANLTRGAAVPNRWTAET
jgi:hypothetical protein